MTNTTNRQPAVQALLDHVANAKNGPQPNSATSQLRAKWAAARKKRPVPGEPMTPTPPREWAGEPAFQLPGEWLGMRSIPPAIMGRHWMTMGETGSGKTVSAVQPLTHSLLTYQLANGDRASLLVIDPKDELAGWIRKKLDAAGESDRLVVVSPELRVVFFEGLQHLSITDRLALLESIAPNYYRDPEGNSAHWIELGRSMLRELVQAEALYREKFPDGSLVEAVRADLTDLAGGAIDNEADLSYFGHVKTITNFARSSHRGLKQVQGVFVKIAQEAGLPARIADPFGRYASASDLIEQFNYVVMTLDPLLEALCNPDVQRLVELSPFEFGGGEGTLSVREQIENGKVLLFSPGAIAHESTNVVGRVLKTKFFQASFCRKNKERPVGYVCDEFQRFITSDPESGEQSFLDRCRAHRVICVLATQSVASIEYAIGNDRRSNSAISVILNNTAGKIFMRNTDPSTMGAMRNLLPAAPLGSPHVTEVRPATTLKPGEAYYLLADGKWGRKQIQLQPGLQ